MADLPQDESSKSSPAGQGVQLTDDASIDRREAMQNAVVAASAGGAAEAMASKGAVAKVSAGGVVGAVGIAAEALAIGTVVAAPLVLGYLAAGSLFRSFMGSPVKLPLANDDNDSSSFPTGHDQPSTQPKATSAMTGSGYPASEIFVTIPASEQLGWVMTDWEQAYAWMESGGFNPYSGQFVAVLNCEFVGSGPDALDLRREVAAARNVHPEQVVVMLVD